VVPQGARRQHAVQGARCQLMTQPERLGSSLFLRGLITPSSLPLSMMEPRTCICRVEVIEHAEQPVHMFFGTWIAGTAGGSGVHRAGSPVPAPEAFLPQKYEAQVRQASRARRRCMCGWTVVASTIERVRSTMLPERCTIVQVTSPAVRLQRSSQPHRITDGQG
jgi:hypothetical protein